MPKAVSPRPSCSHPDWTQLDPRGCFVAHLTGKVGRSTRQRPGGGPVSRPRQEVVPVLGCLLLCCTGVWAEVWDKSHAVVVVLSQHSAMPLTTGSADCQYCGLVALLPRYVVVHKLLLLLMHSCGGRRCFTGVRVEGSAVHGGHAGGRHAGSSTAVALRGCTCGTSSAARCGR